MASGSSVYESISREGTVFAISLDKEREFQVPFQRGTWGEWNQN